MKTTTHFGTFGSGRSSVAHESFGALVADLAGFAGERLDLHERFGCTVALLAGLALDSLAGDLVLAGQTARTFPTSPARRSHRSGVALRALITNGARHALQTLGNKKSWVSWYDLVIFIVDKAVDNI